MYNNSVTIFYINLYVIHYYIKLNGGEQKKLIEAVITTASNQRPLLMETNGDGCFARLG